MWSRIPLYNYAYVDVHACMYVQCNLHEWYSYKLWLQELISFSHSHFWGAYSSVKFLVVSFSQLSTQTIFYSTICDSALFEPPCRPVNSIPIEHTVWQCQHCNAQQGHSSWVVIILQTFIDTSRRSKNNRENCPGNICFSVFVWLQHSTCNAHCYCYWYGGYQPRESDFCQQCDYSIHCWKHYPHQKKNAGYLSVVSCPVGTILIATMECVWEYF